MAWRRSRASTAMNRLASVQLVIVRATTRKDTKPSTMPGRGGARVRAWGSGQGSSSCACRGDAVLPGTPTRVHILRDWWRRGAYAQQQIRRRLGGAHSIRGSKGGEGEDEEEEPEWVREERHQYPGASMRTKAPVGAK